MGTQGVNAALSHTSAKFELGVEVRNPANPKQTLVYVQADDAVVALNALTRDYAAGGSGAAGSVPFLVTTTSAVAQEVVGISEIAIAAGSFAWIVKNGPVDGVNVASSVAAGEILVTTSTAGRLDDHVSTGTNPSDADHDALTQASGGATIVATSAESSNAANVLLV
jgi:hypothetical protein